MDFYNLIIYSATKFHPYTLIYGNPVVIPSSLNQNAKTQSNNSEHQYEIKRLMQAAQTLARSNLLEAKYKPNEHYDKTENLPCIKVGQ